MIPRDGWRKDMTLRWILFGAIIVLFIFADLTK